MERFSFLMLNYFLKIITGYLLEAWWPEALVGDYAPYLRRFIFRMCIAVMTGIAGNIF